MPLSELGVGQLHLNARELHEIISDFSVENLCAEPLKVYDFGVGRFFLLSPPDHHRAYAAWRAGIASVPVVCDTWEGWEEDYMCTMFLDDVFWGEKLGVKHISDLAKRILSDADYERLFIRRCERGSDLYLETNPANLPAYAALRPDLHLYGISDDLQTLYFEDEQENVIALAVPAHLK